MWANETFLADSPEQCFLPELTLKLKFLIQHTSNLIDFLHDVFLGNEKSTISKSLSVCFNFLS